MARSRAPGFLLGFGLALALAACAAATVVETQCLPMATYTSAEQAALSTAYHGLPADSILRRVVMDYLALRDANRACQSTSHQTAVSP